MTRNPQSGVTLIEILIAVTLLSLLSLGTLIAMQLGLSTMEKTDRRIVSNRRITGARKILESEIEGFIPSRALFFPKPAEPYPVPFLQAERQSMRFVSSYSLVDASRGRPQIIALQVAPREGEGVRLIVNETPYTGPVQAGLTIVGVTQDPSNPRTIVHFAPIEEGPGSFILADSLAYCRFWYLEARTEAPFRVWRPDWVDNSRLPLGIRVEMEPLDHSSVNVHETTVTVPFSVSRRNGVTYVDQ